MVIGKVKVPLGRLRMVFAKRLFRVQPPFIIACVVAIILNIVSTKIPGYAGELSSDYPVMALKSLGFDSLYLSGILGQSWILVVAWTLAIEVQFYLLLGIVYPLLSMQKPRTLGIGLILLMTGSLWLTDEQWIFSWMPFFALG